MDKKITIITICYNESAGIRKTIESVLRQTYTDIEYLIIDGASADGTMDIIKEYLGDDRIRFLSEADRGIYNAMNKGITIATGDYVNFLNAGDWFYDENVLSKVVEYISNANNAILYGNCLCDMPDHSKIFVDFDLLEGTLEEKALRGSMPLHQTIFAPRSFLTDHYFRESFTICADYEWFVYCVSRHIDFVKMPITVCYFDRTGLSSKAEIHKLKESEVVKIISEYIDRSGQDDNYKKTAVKNLAAYRELAQRNGSLFQLMLQWVSLKQRGIGLDSWFERKKYMHIAIYGMSHVGLRLADELDGSDVLVEYGIDRNAAGISCGIPLKIPEDQLEEVDAIVVTAVTFYAEIVEKLKSKVSAPVVSLEDIIRDMLRKKV